MSPETNQSRRSLPRPTKRSVIVAVSGLLIGASGLALLSGKPIVAPHSGDGEFKNISWRFPWQSFGLGVPGYTITFPEIELCRELEASYQLRDLPRLSPEVGIYLYICDPTAHLIMDRNPGSARFAFELLDERGKIVAQLDEPLSELIPTNDGGRGCTAFYDLDRSFFRSTHGSSYRLKVRYTPDPELSDLRGFVLIRCGGSI